jgi:hypothetical protein
VSYLKNLSFQGRRLRLAWEEIRRGLDQEDDPMPDLERAEDGAWQRWVQWAAQEGFCPQCCLELAVKDEASGRVCANVACPG